MRRCSLTTVVFVVACGLLAAQAPPSRLVIVNARLLDLQAGRVRPVAAVEINGATIAAIHATAPPAGLEGTRVDAGGAVLVPALADLSLQTVPGMDLDSDYYYSLCLAHGVMLARTVDVHLPWAVQQRRRLEAGDGIAPWLRTSGPAIDMRTPLGARNQALLPGGVQPLARVGDAAGVAAEVRRQAAAGVDWIRLEGNVPLEGVRMAVAAARGAKVRVSLAPFATSMTQAAQAGVALLDGLGLPSKSLVDLESYTPRTRPQPGTAPAAVAESVWAELSAGDRRALVAALRRPGITVAPMLLAADLVCGAGANLDRDLAFLPERLRTPIVGDLTARAEAARLSKVAAGARAGRLAFVKELVAQGGRVVTASGARATGFPVPGLAIHREMALLVEAGLAPVDAIRAATVWADAALGLPTRGLRPGSPADFFVVRGDPLVNVGDLTNITLLVRAGEVIDRADLLRQAKRSTGKVQ